MILTVPEVTPLNQYCLLLQDDTTDPKEANADESVDDTKVDETEKKDQSGVVSDMLSGSEAEDSTSDESDSDSDSSENKTGYVLNNK